MKIVLLEDEIIVVRDLKSRLSAMGYDRVEAFDNGKDFLQHIKKESADLCLIDININGDMDGIETVKNLPEGSKLPIIYLTAQGDKETFESAKETKPSAYLLKPYNAFELQSAIELAVQNFEDENTSNVSKEEEEDSVLPIDDKIFVKHNNRYDRVSISDILYLEAFGNYTEIHTAEKHYVVVNQLGKIATTLKDKTLYRCHRSFIVNLQAVEGFDEAYLFVGKKSIPVSKSQRGELLSKLRIV